ncbi:hypothetical protein HanIR_Chr12g0564511 [Helianthus annuus]|nr:hypothetical protein HanIR_Chr12g0564511 [Helianthus annuus]
MLSLLTTLGVSFPSANHQKKKFLSLKCVSSLVKYLCLLILHLPQGYLMSETGDAEVVMEMEADACDGVGGVGVQDDDGGRWWEGVDVVKKKL